MKMAKPLNYSKWDHIEISDDEDDTHPNIDTASLFKWRHEARVDRMEQSKKEKEQLESVKIKNQQKLAEVKQKVQHAEQTQAAEELSKLKITLTELEKQDKEFRKKEDELQKKEKLAPLNVDTICHDGMSKTVINKSEPAQAVQMTEEDRLEKQQKFQDKHESLIKKFGMFRRYEDSQAFLSDHPDLACEETANYLVLWCINLEMEEKSDLMAHVSHQTIVMQFILELAKSLEVDPRSCIRAFFSRIKMAEKQYMDAFNDELNSFKDRVRTRAKARIEEAVKQVEEEERQQRLGPGGLDPVEVFESLPKEMQDCFESKNIEFLQEIIAKMDPKMAEYHMKRCVGSGMWLPDGGKSPAAQAAGEEVYEEVPEKVDSPEK